MSDSFVHLHLHTEYSLLDGAVRIDALMKKAVKCGMPAVAMTDHGNLYGAIDFYKSAKKAKIKGIIGCEIYLAPGSMHEKKEVPGRKNASHLTLLAHNNTGYSNLVKLVSKAHLEGQYYKPRVDKAALGEFSEGIICLSGCINGEINEFIRNEQIDQARESLKSFLDIYGKENFYLELHDHGMEAQEKCNWQLLEFAKEFGLKPVAANDVHFLEASDREAHEVMLCIGTGKMLMDESRMRYSPEVYFKTAKEMRKLFKAVPQACENTLEIADRCDLKLEMDASSTAKYPQFGSPDGSPREEYFKRVCWEGLERRFGAEKVATDEPMRERLVYEMGIMERMGFLSYFLIVWDFIKWAKDNGIPVGPGRGSAAGSLVAYALGITDLDPIRFSLVFERFLNPERVSPPDIDVDFCQTRRGEVIEYVRQKYGEKAVSHIITFGTLGAKSVVRDVARVMGMSYGDGDRLAKMIPTELNITLADARKKNADLKAAIEADPQVAELWRYATFLEGLTRGVGIHAAGIVIGSTNLDIYVPLTRGNADEVVTQYAMKPLTDLGMLKMDFLGLKTLTVIFDAVTLIHKHTPDFDISTIPLDDPPTFVLLSAGKTTGVFQLESGGMVNLCKNFGPDTIDHIIALIALYRPGPMQFIPDFVERKKGKQKVKYLHPLLENISRETYGILVYQEQVQQAANLLAGYTLGQADLLRRAMGKKDAEEMARQRTTFVAGCASVNQIPDKQANEIFDLLEKFAEYGFNKSHSAAYGLVTYQTAYLKANYPVEFMSALLSNEVSNTDKIAVFVAEVVSMGLKILPPDVNRSQLKFVPEGEGAIRFGLAAIKNVGEGAMQLAVTEREKNGEYVSMEDFATRLDSKSVNKKILENLVRAGAFDFIGEHRASLFSRVDGVLASAQSAQKDRAAGQASLFDMMELAPAAPKNGEAAAGTAVVTPWSPEQLLQDEKDLLGFYVSGHPLDRWRMALEHPKFTKLAHLSELQEGKKPYTFGCLVSAVEVKYTKAGKAFAIMGVEDFTGGGDAMVWNDTWEKVSSKVVKGAVVEMKARIETDSRSEMKRLVVAELNVLPTPAEVLELHLDTERHTAADLDELAKVLAEHPGKTQVVFCVRKAGWQGKLVSGARFNVDPATVKPRLGAWLTAGHKNGGNGHGG